MTTLQAAPALALVSGRAAPPAARPARRRTPGSTACAPAISAVGPDEDPAEWALHLATCERGYGPVTTPRRDLVSPPSPPRCGTRPAPTGRWPGHGPHPAPKLGNSHVRSRPRRRRPGAGARAVADHGSPLPDGGRHRDPARQARVSRLRKAKLHGLIVPHPARPNPPWPSLPTKIARTNRDDANHTRKFARTNCPPTPANPKIARPNPGSHARTPDARTNPRVARLRPSRCWPCVPGSSGCAADCGHLARRP